MGLTGGHDCLLFGPKTLFFSNWKSLELTASNGFFCKFPLFATLIAIFMYVGRILDMK